MPYMPQIPTEILLEIFSLGDNVLRVNQRVDTSEIVTSTTGSAFLLRGVCSQWKDIIIGCPNLFCYVDIHQLTTSSSEGFELHLQKLLSFSQTQPIYVKVAILGQELPGVILQHHHRLEGFFLDANVDATTVARYFPRSFPIMRQLFLCVKQLGPGENTTAVSIDAPLLKRMELIDNSSQISIKHPELECLAATVHPQNFLRMLKSSPHLSEVVYSNDRPLPFVINGASSLEIITCTNLSSLVISLSHMFAGSFSCIISSLTLPSLSSLAIEGSPDGHDLQWPLDWKRTLMLFFERSNAQTSLRTLVIDQSFVHHSILIPILHILSALESLTLNETDAVILDEDERSNDTVSIELLTAMSSTEDIIVPKLNELHLSVTGYSFSPPHFVEMVRFRDGRSDGVEKLKTVSVHVTAEDPYSRLELLQEIDQSGLELELWKRSMIIRL